MYGHQFDAAEHAERASAGLERSFGSLLDGYLGVPDEPRVSDPTVSRLGSAEATPGRACSRRDNRLIGSGHRVICLGGRAA